MKHNWIFTGVILVTLLVGAALGACAVSAGADPAPVPSSLAVASPSPSPVPSEETTNYTSPIRFGRYGIKKYTTADYDLAMSFATEGWQNMSIADFNAKILNVKDETAFHKVEDSLLRVIWTLDEKDTNSGFLLGPLRTSIYECRTQHYNACAHDQLPSWDNYVERLKYADVFGDNVEIASSYASFGFRYRITDEHKTTVAQRDAFLLNIDNGMQAFLDKQAENDLKKEDAMEKSLTAELVRLAKEQGGSAITAEGCEVDYYSEDYYD